jgi:hypothetical protein
LFNENVEIETFNTTEDDEEDAKVVAATDMAFQIIRNGQTISNSTLPSRHLRCMKSICFPFKVESFMSILSAVK